MDEAKLLAIRKVTQDNKGKRTAGVDGIKKIDGKQRLEMVKNLKIDGKASPIRRIYIPKPGKAEKRPLGIPTIKDRVKQQVVKLALEPQWEAKFENNSYGFRPGRGTMDAIAHVRSSLYTMEKPILDADIRKCFDMIDHDVLLKKVNTSPTISRQIHAWLKAGIMDPEISLDPITNNRGTPQGGIVSPLLSNIALHGMEEAMQSNYTAINKTVKNEKKYRRDYLTFVRYADDFVVIHPSLHVILKMKEIISNFLKEIGLELNEEKTKVRHSVKPIVYNNQIIKPGLKFLGVFYRLHPSKSSETKSPGKTNHRTLFRFRSTSCNENYREHLEQIRVVLKTSRGLPQEAIIRKLSPIINGWTLFYRYTHCKHTFTLCDHKMFWMLVKWCLRRHNNMGKKAILSKYFIQHRGRNWTFGLYRQGIYHKVLPFHSHRNHETYQKVKGDYSPYSIEHVNTVRNFKLTTDAAKMFTRQHGICKWCLYPFQPDDLLEIHHTLPKNHEKREYLSNKWLIHRHCHDDLHAHNFFDFYEGYKDPTQKEG